MRDVDKTLAKAAAELSSSAPDSWSRLLVALQAYSAAQSTACVQAPLDILPVAQGRAQAVLTLTKLFSEAREIAEKLK